MHYMEFYVLRCGFWDPRFKMSRDESMNKRQYHVLDGTAKYGIVVYVTYIRTGGSILCRTTAVTKMPKVTPLD